MGDRTEVQRYGVQLVVLLPTVSEARSLYILLGASLKPLAEDGILLRPPDEDVVVWARNRGRHCPGKESTGSRSPGEGRVNSPASPWVARELLGRSSPLRDF